MPAEVIDPTTARALETKQLSDGAIWRLLDRTDQSQVAYVQIEPGSDSGKMNTHPGDQIFYVRSGTATILVDERETTVPEGQLVVIEAGTAHHVFNRGSILLEFLSVYAPSF